MRGISQNLTAISTFRAKEPKADDLLNAVAEGDKDATRKVAGATGLSQARVRELARLGAEKQVWGLAARDADLLGAFGLAREATAGGIAAGGTVAHLTGFRDFKVPAKKPPVDPATIAQSMVAVLAGLPLEALAKPLQAEVRSLLEQKGHALGTAPADAVYKDAAAALGADTMKKALGELAVAVRTMAPAVERSARWQPGDGTSDRRNWHRIWGLSLLPHDDKAFKDPDYLLRLNVEAGQISSHFRGNSASNAKQRFEAAWKKLSPTTQPIAFTDSGSDAVSLTWDIANLYGRKRAGEDNNNPNRRNYGVAFFAGMYGGGRGQAGGVNWEHYGKSIAPNFDNFALPDCTSYERNPKDPEEKARLDGAEKEALTRIRALADDPQQPIGAVLFEPILGSKGVRFFRPEFVQKLRALADELQLPIVADEVLTGGGRTGKFFAYEHYEGFQPDFVTFGKGLQTAGMAAVSRRGSPLNFQRMSLGMTTVEGDPVRLLKGEQVLKRIAEDNLVENAANVGAHLLKKLKEQDTGSSPATSGVGLLIGTNVQIGTTTADGGARSRLMPPLTLTKADVDEILANPRGA